MDTRYMEESVVRREGRKMTASAQIWEVSQNLLAKVLPVQLQGFVDTTSANIDLPRLHIGSRDMGHGTDKLFVTRHPLEERASRVHAVSFAAEHFHFTFIPVFLLSVSLSKSQPT